MNHLQDEKFMRRCLELAVYGVGETAPNPVVGSVVVDNDIIIGEGYHQKYGEVHAEVNAIDSVKDKSLLQHSILYVNLEPCSHYGKTPPCADYIIKNKIPQVVIGTIDPNPDVSGSGIEKLKKAGCIVRTNVLENDCEAVNKHFFVYHKLHRPYIILKWAQTSDGFIDIVRNLSTPVGSTRISGEFSRILDHKWRSQEQAIMVGTNTVVKDNPMLTNRYWSRKSPVRVILDRNLSLDHSLHIFDLSSETILINNIEDKIEGNLHYVKIDYSKDVISQILSVLYLKNILSVIIEGGTKLINSFVEKNLWDEARVFVADLKFEKGLEAPLIINQTYVEYILPDGLLRIYKNSGILNHLI